MEGGKTAIERHRIGTLGPRLLLFASRLIYIASHPPTQCISRIY